jgi:subtilisin family serine protease
MRKSGRVAAVVLACIVPQMVVGPAAHAAPADRPPAATRGLLATITLITGDKVDVIPGSGGPGTVRVRPGNGRERIGFTETVRNGRLQVVPRDAEALLAAGQLDRRLFDVTGLVEDGYGDAATGELPLIVAYVASARTAAAGTLSTTGARVVRDLPSVAGAAVRQPKDRSNRLWAALTGGNVASRSLTGGLAKVWLDGKLQPSLRESVPQISAPAAWRAGYTGKGVPVAVLDTGYDANHPDLRGAVSEAHNFTDSPDTGDQVGHGTHVASTVAGRATASDGVYKGVAPSASLYIGKVCDVTGCPESSVLPGMEWAASRARVINMSLGGPGGDGTDPLSVGLNTLTAQTGALFVVAAGNSGEHGDQTVTTPALADAALAVGAVNKNDELASFSSRGPRAGDAAVKPEITAPGVGIVAARAAGTGDGKPVNDHYTTFSGTSMAAPHVAGAAALLAEQHPDWKAEQLKGALMGSAEPNPAVGVYGQGAGRVNVARAISQGYATPPSLTYGVQRWPHNDDKPVDRTLTYHNPGTTALTLSLTLHVTGENGAPAPAGMFRLSAGTVTVPPAGTATVPVVADTSVDSPVGIFAGTLVARSADGGTVIRTPLSVIKELESYDLTVRFLDRHGNSAEIGGATLTDLNNANNPNHPTATPANPTMRVPKGDYVFWAMAETPGAHDVTYFPEPRLRVDRNATIVLDSRDGHQVDLTVERRDATFIGGTLTMISRLPEGSVQSVSPLSGAATPGGKTFVRPSRSNRPPQDVAFAVKGDWAKRAGDGKFVNSPYVYHGAFYSRGKVPAQQTHHLRDADLATVHTHYRAPAAGKGGETMASASLPDLTEFSTGIYLAVRVPSTRTEYYTTGEHRWFNTMLQYPDESRKDGTVEALLTGVTDGLRAGRHVEQWWNRPVFSPAMAASASDRPAASRRGDEFDVAIGSVSDGSGHWGDSRTESASTTLYRDGVKVGSIAAPTYGRFRVPAQAANYRLTSEIRRLPGVSDLSTSQTVSWSFRSAHTLPELATPLPLMVIRPQPMLGDDDAAPAGWYTLPLTVQRQGGTDPARLTSLTVQVSYDDGATWRPALVVGPVGDHAIALLNQPRTGGYVSLKIAATDAGGNSVEQTVVQAYRLRA